MFRSIAAWLTLALCACTAFAQRSTPSLSDDELAQAVADSVGPAGIVPDERGPNLSLISSSQHDSVSGWSNVLTPSAAYRFNRFFSVDVSTPIFLYLRTTGASATTGTIQHGIFGDTFMAAHGSLPHFSVPVAGEFRDTLTVALVAPTGSTTAGVGAGKTTYNVTNHLESQTLLSPYFDLGIGSGSRVQNRRVQRAQTATGELLNLSGGVSIDLPLQATLSLEGYEQLPLSSATVTQTVTRKGRPKKTTTDSGLAEDNGVNTSLDLPLTRHITLSGFYSRSVAQQEDTAGFSLTFLMRAASRTAVQR